MGPRDTQEREFVPRHVRILREVHFPVAADDQSGRRFVGSLGPLVLGVGAWLVPVLARGIAETFWATGASSRGTMIAAR